MGNLKYGEFNFSKDHGFSGSCGGTSAGAQCNIGAWDGTYSQIGCNF
jgi:hypothetical protein